MTQGKHSVLIRVSLTLLMMCAGALAVVGQDTPETPKSNLLEAEAPVANPGRPTVSTPATLAPTGHFQFETGVLSAWVSPEFSSQTELNEVVKFSVSRRIELLAGAEPVAHSRSAGATANAAGGVSLGVQGVLYQGEGRIPTIGLSYFRNVYGGNAPDLDIGSSTNSVLLLGSADVKKFHYDFNLLFNEVVLGQVRRAQFGQSLSISHPVTAKLGLSGEVWHFTQPFLRGDAVGNLWSLSYMASKVLVFDAGFDRGLTSTSTQWEVFAGFTYLLPHKVFHR